MSIRGLILRALIALSMFLGMAGASQAAPWQRINPQNPVTVIHMEMMQPVLAQIRNESLWSRFLSKVTWSKAATRMGAAGCAVSGAAAVTQDSFAQQRTWWLKGLRVLSSCGAAAAAAGLLDFTQAIMLAAAAPELVAFGTAVVLSAAAGWGLEYATEKLWAAHSHGNGTAAVDATGVTPPRRSLKVHDDEYASVSRTTTHLSNLRHPESRWSNGTHIDTSTASHVSWDSVGGSWHPRYIPAGRCGG